MCSKVLHYQFSIDSSRSMSFNPKLFMPDWKGQGTFLRLWKKMCDCIFISGPRTRLSTEHKIHNLHENCLYRDGVAFAAVMAEVQNNSHDDGDDDYDDGDDDVGDHDFLSQVENQRVCINVKTWAPPNTPLSEFFSRHHDDLVEATRATQEKLAEGARIFKEKGRRIAVPHLARHFQVDDPQNLPEERPPRDKGAARSQLGQRPPLPKIQVAGMIMDQLQDYLPLLLDWAADKNGRERAKFCKWPKYEGGLLVEAATEMQEWDAELEEICPRDFFKGPHKSFQKGRGPAGSGASRLAVVCGWLLRSYGEDPNSYCEEIMPSVPDFDQLVNQLKGGVVLGKRKRFVDHVQEEDNRGQEEEAHPSRRREKKKKKKSKKSKHRRRRSPSSSSSDSSSSSSEEDNPRKRARPLARTPVATRTLVGGTSNHANLAANPAPAVSSVVLPGRPVAVRDEFASIGSPMAHSSMKSMGTPDGSSELSLS